MLAVVNLMVVIMVEAGKVPFESANKIGSTVLKAIVGKSKDEAEKTSAKK